MSLIHELTLQIEQAENMSEAMDAFVIANEAQKDSGLPYVEIIKAAFKFKDLSYVKAIYLEAINLPWLDPIVHSMVHQAAYLNKDLLLAGLSWTGAMDSQNWDAIIECVKTSIVWGIQSNNKTLIEYIFREANNVLNKINPNNMAKNKEKLREELNKVDRNPQKSLYGNLFFQSVYATNPASNLNNIELKQQAKNGRRK